MLERLSSFITTLPAGTGAHAPAPTLTTARPEPPVVNRNEALQEVLSGLLEDRLASFTMADALEMPPVIRGLGLITSVGSPLVAYRGGAVLEHQPRILTQPDPFRDRSEWVSLILHALATEGWCPLLLERNDDADEFPRSAIVLDGREVSAEWDERRFLPVYHWRGQLMEPNRLKVIRINPRAGELLGFGPIRQGLDALAVVQAAEDYAMGFFGTGGVPETVLKIAQALTDDQAATIKQRYMESRAEGTGVEPVVLGSGADISFPNAKPDESQMHESRAYGATVVARLLGIPAALLHVETSGATVTYQNSDLALDGLVRQTVQPTYLSPIERAMSTLVPRGITVRFELSELMRTNVAARLAMYAQAISTTDASGSSLMTVEEARALEGWGAGPHSEVTEE